MGGQPWPELELHGRPRGARRRGRGRGRGGIVGGRGMGGGGGQQGEEAPWGCRRSSVWAALVRSLLLLAAREEDHVGKKGKRRERKRKGLEKNRKNVKPENFMGEK
jgi:hypothetical protein